MGQEWAATTPFLFFTDHPAELGRLVTVGRRNEFRHFSAFSDSETRARIPDPQSEKTFLASKLKWDEVEHPSHAATLRLYQRLLALRRTEPAVRCGSFQASDLSDTALLLRHDSETGPSLLVVIQMKGSANVALPTWPALDPRRCRLLFTTEDAEFASDSRPIEIELAVGTPKIQFQRPGAALFLIESDSR
jgi:maltooligosyltrehalose trehalohydrolase